MAVVNPTLPQSGIPNADTTVAEKRKKPLLRQIYENRWSYLFILPWLILTALFGWYPLPASIQVSFYNWKGFGTPDQYVGIRHFVTVLTDPFFWKAVKNAVQYTAVLVLIQLILALTLVLVLNNPRLRFGNVFRAAFFIPAVCSTVVLAVPVRSMISMANRFIPAFFVDNGWFNPSLGFLQDPKLALWVIIVFGIWQSFGYNLVFFLAALQSVPQELYEAATVDGAGFWTKFWHITIPLIKPVGTIIVILAVLGSMRVFDSVLALTNGGPYYASEVPTTYIYHFAFSPMPGSGSANLGYASASSMVYSFLLLGLTAMQIVGINRARARRRELGLS